MKRPEENDYFEEIIHMEAVVDAYGEEERAMGWYYFLKDRLMCPFSAVCREEKRTNRLKKDQTYTVVGMADVKECDRDMYVLIEEEDETGKDQLAVALSQLAPSGDVDEDMLDAIMAWHYWVDRGYQF